MVQIVQQQPEQIPWTEEEFRELLYAHKSRYHDLHSFHQRMNQGLLSPTEINKIVGS